MLWQGRPPCWWSPPPTPASPRQTWRAVLSRWSLNHSEVSKVRWSKVRWNLNNSKQFWSILGCSRKSWQDVEIKQWTSVPPALRLPLPPPPPPPLPQRWSPGTSWRWCQVPAVHQAQVPLCFRVTEVPWPAPRCGSWKVFTLDVMVTLKHCLLDIWLYCHVFLLAV